MVALDRELLLYIYIYFFKSCLNRCASSSTDVYFEQSQPEAKVVVAAAGAFHSGFLLCKHFLPCTKLDKG